MFALLGKLKRPNLAVGSFKKGQKRPNGQFIFFLVNRFKKGQEWIIWPLKRPNGNHVIP